MTIKIWGMGLGAKDLLGFISGRDIKVVGITDSFTTETGSFLGIEVYLADQWSRIECDYAVICAVGYEEEIREKIKNLNPLDKIVTCQEFGLILYDRVYKDNDLWKFFRKNGHRSLLKQVTYFNVYDKWLSRFRGTNVFLRNRYI